MKELIDILNPIKKSIGGENTVEYYLKFQQIEGIFNVYKRDIERLYLSYQAPIIDTDKVIKDISEYFPKLEWEVETGFKHCLVVKTIPSSKLYISFDYNYTYKLWSVCGSYNNIDLLPDTETEGYIERFSDPNIKECAKTLKENIENLFTIKEFL